ncbi:clusterin [Microcaecilia unicolor]|uniref:Clusterin-like n=1 Tax=Microcaecilia unicolor TaxID=1415580 RepID=A0A6P7X644_9AMPH|nr:clusterin-like [Microcaecilia unicolor]
MECDINNIFKDSMKACEEMMSFCNPCFMKCFQEAMKAPASSQNRQDPVEMKVVRKDKQDLQGPCHDLFESCHKMVEGINQMVENAGSCQKSQDSSPRPSLKSDAIQEKGNNAENQMMCCCVELCQTDIPKRRERYDKHKEIQSGGSRGLQEQFDESMRLAEKLTNQCEDLLQRLQKEMSATANLLEQLSEQIGSMSSPEKKEETNDEVFQMTTVLASAKTGKRSSDTSLTMQVFDSNPNTYSGPGDTSWEDSKYSKPQAQRTSNCCRKRTIVAGCQSVDRGWKH